MFNMRSELRFRLATNISAVLEPRGDERLQLYLRVKQLYNLRSRIVHGSAVKDGEIVAHVLEVRDLLSRLLCKAIEDGQLANEAAIEKLVFE